jgi:hypothetical protein
VIDYKPEDHMRLSRYDDRRLRQLHGHIRSELERHPFVDEAEPRFPERRRALGIARGERPVAADSAQALRAVVIDAWYAGGPVSLVLTPIEATLEFGSGERVASRAATLEPILRELFGVGADILPTLAPARGTALPAANLARIWVRTANGLFVTEGPMEQWSRDEHNVAMLYRLGVSVMGLLLEGGG